MKIISLKIAPAIKMTKFKFCLIDYDFNFVIVVYNA